MISGLTKENQLKEFTAPFTRNNEFETVYWETSGLEYVNPINPEMKIVFQNTEVTFYGCGAAAFAVFKVTDNEFRSMYQTELEDLKTNKKIIFYISEGKEKLKVGHGMCAGAFTFTKAGKYTVRFTPWNIDGKELKSQPGPLLKAHF